MGRPLLKPTQYENTKIKTSIEYFGRVRSKIPNFPTRYYSGDLDVIRIKKSEGILKKLLIIFMLVLMSFGASAQAYKEKDKQLHFFVGMTISGVAYELSDGDFLWTVGTTAVGGLAKELYDTRKGGSGFDVVDLGATVLGGFVSYGLGEIGIPGGIIGLSGLTGLYFRMNF